MLLSSSVSRVAAHQGRTLLASLGKKSSRSLSSTAFRTFSRNSNARYFPVLAGATAAGFFMTQFALDEKVCFLFRVLT